MITAEVTPGKNESHFKITLFTDGEHYTDIEVNALSAECVRFTSTTCARITTEDCDMDIEVNDALSRLLYDMGYKKIVYSAPSGTQVTRHARLYRKARGMWHFMVPLDEIYG